MPNRKFPILGTSVPPMLGREATMERMWGALTKATPDHLQMVGPRFAGKTVVLRELARRLRETDGRPYTAVRPPIRISHLCSDWLASLPPRLLKIIRLTRTI